jgi:hypothetical protein
MRGNTPAAASAAQPPQAPLAQAPQRLWWAVPEPLLRQLQGKS